MDRNAPTPPPSKIPIEEVARYPQPGTSVPSSIRFVPEGGAITYLHSPEGTLVQRLFIQDLATGQRHELFVPPEGGATEENLSAEEKLQRERMRDRSLGITRYAWAKKRNRLLVPLRGDIWIQDGDAPPRKLVEGGDAPILDPRMSRDGAFVAYVHRGELHVVSAGGGTPRRLTEGAAESLTHGLAEYIAQEEMGRHHGYWWSWDARHLAYTEVDERHIPIFTISHSSADTPYEEKHRYPFAGAANAKVRLGVVPREGGRTTWMDLGMEGEDPEDLYLARVAWMPDGSLVAAIENRAQTRLDLVRFDIRTGARTVLLTERSDVWINLHDVLEPFETTEGELAGGFLWASERDGFRHLYVHDRTGAQVRQLTSGEWMVDALECLDEANGWVYFSATRDGPTERHVYRVPLAGGDIERLTESPGMHGAVFDRACTTWVDIHSTLEHPPTFTVRAVGAAEPIARIEVDPDPRVAKLGLTPPRLVTLQTRDGVTLHGAIYEPQGRTPPYPTLVSVYGGPHAQRVTASWGMTVDMRAQYLRDLGYLVFKLDNRGSARRGLAFEGAIKYDLGNIEVQDQVDGVRWLVDQGLTDPERVGIYGWSYGGYMAAMALVRAPETFKVGVAGAPVSRWDAYDTHYTERYMGTPQSNPEGYRSSSVMTHVEAMRGSLLLVHGLIDENVHFRHTAHLLDALIAARKDHQILLFPAERHMPRREKDRVYMEERIRDFLAEKL